ncbi:MAG: DUF1819 family protein [Desulfobacterales bacterium]|uniref:DUF1819 family protein n=1 Tax=Candidatus Desulfatibia vada TaxID=2841696 RepID=A0A8J6NNY4_9BACT|nr:DUF1819 family protein [Candidatus Desulfatibia vada]MBL6971558.1 DUF1819 family protein [Desulfobacterales bacterium]
MKLKTTYNNKIKYSGDIVAGSLLIAESRKIAQLLLKGVDEKQWDHAIVIENILQKRSPVAAKRQARLIKNRLILMKPDLWELVHKGGSDESIQALLAAAIKHSRLLGDFLGQIVHEHWRTFKPEINVKDWKYFFETCSQADPQMLKWTESTRSKLKQIVFRILTESNYIDETRSGQIQSVTVLPKIKKYLTRNSEDYVLRCMQATQ